MLRCECVGFEDGVWVRVEWVLPRRSWDVIRGVAGVFSFKVWLKYAEDSRWVCRDVVGGWISYCVEFGLVFGVRL